MSREYLTLEPVPWGEEAADIDRRGYAALARRQCEALIGQLRRRFGPEPPGADLRTKAMPHDGGTYYVVVCYHDDPAAEQYALRLEAELPDRWDDEARKKLGLDRK